SALFFLFCTDMATTEIYTLSYTTLFRSVRRSLEWWRQRESLRRGGKPGEIVFKGHAPVPCELLKHGRLHFTARFRFSRRTINFKDRKSTRLNSSHSQISYAVFCLKKKKY